MFFDFLATPQRPRTDDEEERFRIAMERMNSVYVYADVILFLEVDLPDLDMTAHSAERRSIQVQVLQLYRYDSSE